MRLIRAKDYNDVSRKAANIIAAQIYLKPDCVLGLATGSSPVGTYKELIAKYEAGDLDFSQVRTVNLDEYVGLTKDHDQSYAYFMRSNLFDHVNIDQNNCNIPNGMNPDAEAECARYDAVIDAFGGADLQLLGLGPNGHIGFNEPADAFVKGTNKVALTASTIDANARFFASRDDVPTHAYTMGIGSIMKAKRVLLVVNGDAPLLSEALVRDFLAEAAGADLSFATIVPDNDRQPYDVLDVIRCIVDYGEFVQVHELFASSAVVGFACVNGHPVGIVANQPNVNAGILDVDSSEKVARFVRLCDAFNLPVVTLVDTPGYKPGAEQEHAGIIRRGAKVIYAYANAQVPLVTVILRKAFGGAYIVMGSKAIGADLNYAWPSSQIAVLGAAGAVNIIHRKDLQKAKDAGKDVEALRAKYVADYERTTVNANLSLEMGEIDAMIDPEQTRETIIESLKLLSSKKRVRKTTKHHGNQPL